MPGMPQGRGGEVGETVASFPTYEGAQKAVSALIAADVPARDIAIVGSGLRSVERVTGKLGYATAARQGAINGLLLGLFFSAIFLLGNPSVVVAVFIGVMFVGVALGMLFSIGAYAIVRRRRDFASVMQVIADHYEVTVVASSIHRAREVMGGGAAPPVARPDAPARSAADEGGPRYGERVAPPAYGERTPAEPPRYGERITPAPPEESPAEAAGSPAGTAEAPADAAGDPADTAEGPANAAEGPAEAVDAPVQENHPSEPDDADPRGSEPVHDGSAAPKRGEPADDDRRDA